MPNQRSPSWYVKSSEDHFNLTELPANTIEEAVSRAMEISDGCAKDGSIDWNCYGYSRSDRLIGLRIESMRLTAAGWKKACSKGWCENEAKK